MKGKQTVMKIESFKTKSFAISVIAFPVMLLTGFLMHSNLLKLEPLQTVEQLVGRFHNQPMFHIGHLIVMFAVPVIMIALISFMSVLQGKGKRLGFWGGIIGLFGAFILAVDKGALLFKEKFISKWQTVCIIAGLLLLNNPDIELISSIGALLMCAGYIPWGVRILQGRMKCSSTACPIYDTKKNKDFKCLLPCG